MKLRPIKEFDLPVIDNTTLPSYINGNTIIAETVSEAYVELIYRIRTNGVIDTNSHNGVSQYLLNCQIVITNQSFENLNLEKLPLDESFLNEYVNQLLEADQSENITYTYGKLLNNWEGELNQLEKIVNQFKTDVHTDRAIATLWNPFTHGASGSPCLVLVMPKILNGKLYLTGVYRANEMLKAWPANILQLLALQNNLKDRIDPTLELGDLVTISHSAHIYSYDWEAADWYVEKEYSKHTKHLKFNDPVGNFIKLDNKIQQQLNGTPIAEYPINRNTLRSIIDRNPSIDRYHIAYLASVI